MRERFDQGGAETPDIISSANILAGRAERIAGEFQLIIDGQKVRRIEAAVNQMAPMQERQRIQGREQQLPHFLVTQRSPAQNLGETLFRVFHHHEHELMFARSKPAHLEQTDQMRMSKLGCRRPLRKQRLRLQRIRPHQLDRGVGELFCLMFGEEDRLMVGTAEQPAQGKDAVDALVLPLRPVFAEFRVHPGVFGGGADWIPARARTAG